MPLAPRRTPPNGTGLTGTRRQLRRAPTPPDLAASDRFADDQVHCAVSVQHVPAAAGVRALDPTGKVVIGLADLDGYADFLPEREESECGSERFMRTISALPGR